MATEGVEGRIDSLLELAEERLVTKEEFATRKARLEGERAVVQSELAKIGADIEARSATAIDVHATMRSVRRMGDLFDELDDVVDRRRLLATSLNRVVVRPGQLELHVLASPLLLLPEAAEGEEKVPSRVHSAPARKGENRGSPALCVTA